MRLRIDVGIDAQRYARACSPACSDCGDRFELRLGFDVEAEDVRIERQRDFPRRLADAREGDARTRHAGRNGATQLSFGHDIHAGAELRQCLQHGLVRIRLHGVADQRLHIGKGLREDLIMAGQGRRRIAVEGRADLAGESGEIDPFGMERAAPVIEVMHGRIRATDRE